MPSASACISLDVGRQHVLPKKSPLSGAILDFVAALMLSVARDAAVTRVTHIRRDLPGYFRDSGKTIEAAEPDP